jgi:hypothetical protein
MLNNPSTIEVRQRMATACATHYSGGFAQALAMFRALAPELPKLGDLRLAAECHLWTSHVELRLGNMNEALNAATLASLLARRVGAEDIEGKALTELALHDYFCGYPDRGLVLAQQALEALGAVGDPLWHQYALMAQSEIHLLQGNYGASRDAASKVMALGLRDPTEAGVHHVLGTVMQAWSWALSGNATLGVEMCQSVQHISVRATLKPYARGYEGYCHLELGDAKTALPMLTPATLQLQTWGFKPVLALFAAWQAEAHRQLGDTAACSELLALSEAAAGPYPHGPARGWRLRTHALLASGALRDSRLREAELAFKLVGAEHEVQRTEAYR